jgi:hypothetical protein
MRSLPRLQEHNRQCEGIGTDFINVTRTIVCPQSFGPREISKMTTAYEVALIELGIEPMDPLTEIVASAIFTEPARANRPFGR